MSSSALNTTTVKTSDQIARKAINALLNYNRDVLIELGLSEEKAKVAVPSNAGPVAANVEVKFETDALVGLDYFRQYDVRYSIGSIPNRSQKTVRIWLINKDGTILLADIQYP